ncbi:hypothetical protein QO003_003724 [Arthrobacter silviterrae]|nr:hypothetical protein [Arthrobacter silviterrae]MDQ0279421.1 hypothetical protein [Arthrobacter silviterrae]
MATIDTLAFTDEGCPMSRPIRILSFVAIAALMAAAAAVGVRLWTVHQQTSDWALWPAAVPSKVQFSGRVYSCPHPASPENQSLDGLTIQGRTAGGGDIYAHAASLGPGTTIVVRTDRGLFGCVLIGGQ